MREVKQDSRGSMLGWYWRTARLIPTTQVWTRVKDRNLERRYGNTAWSLLKANFVYRNTCCKTFSLKKRRVWRSSVCRLAVFTVCLHFAKSLSFSNSTIQTTWNTFGELQCTTVMVSAFTLERSYIFKINPILFCPIITAAQFLPNHEALEEIWPNIHYTCFKNATGAPRSIMELNWEGKCGKACLCS